MIIPLDEFAYNDSINRTTRRNPFEVVYGIHPRGILELRVLRGLEIRSAQEEDFALAIKDIHDRVRETLHKNIVKYKEKANEKKRDVQYKVGDLVMTHQKKERLPKGQPTNFLMKKIGPCRIVHKFGPNAYEIELPQGLGIYPIRNVSDLFPYKGDVAGLDAGVQSDGDGGWMKDLPLANP